MFNITKFLDHIERPLYILYQRMHTTHWVNPSKAMTPQASVAITYALDMLMN